MTLQLPLGAGPVRLRRLRPADGPDFLAYRLDPEVARYQSWAPMDAAQSEAFLAEMAEAAPWPVGEWMQLGIAQAADDRLVGDIGLLREAADQVQIGITLARHAQGLGWARAALAALLDALHRQMGVTQARAIADARNAPSLRCFEALGFVEIERAAVVVKGEACVDVTLSRILPAVPAR